MKTASIIKAAAKWLSIIFFAALIYLLFAIWQEGKNECAQPQAIPGDTLPDSLRQSALRPLAILNEYYARRDPAQAGQCISETLIPDEILILGTSPGEIFSGRQGALNLLQGDWKYWGLLKLDVEGASLSQAGGSMYFAASGQVRLDRFCFSIPIKVTGLLAERDSQWYISKMQFVNNLNTNYLIFSWTAAIFLAASLIMLGLFSIISAAAREK